jgi:glutamate-1-semialdehyde 2,1-aminomutase
VKPDLCVFGKAIANGYPMGVIAGRRELLDYFVHPDARKKVLIAGTYNAHPTAVIAAIATIKLLAEGDGALHRELEARGARLQAELEPIFAAAGITARIARQGSAFCVYFMDHLPVDWHDVAEHHDFALDTRYRRALLERGVFHFPLPTKQGSLSAAHTDDLIAETVRATRDAVASLRSGA